MLALNLVDRSRDKQRVQVVRHVSGSRDFDDLVGGSGEDGHRNANPRVHPAQFGGAVQYRHLFATGLPIIKLPWRVSACIAANLTSLSYRYNT